VPGDGATPETALARADALLYEAKGNGRDHARHLDLSSGAAAVATVVAAHRRREEA